MILLRPAIALMQRLRLLPKFALVSLVFLLPLLLASGLLVAELHKSVSFTVQERQGLVVACPEEIAYYLGWITAEEVARIAGPMKMNDYGRYLLRMLDQGAPAR